MIKKIITFLFLMFIYTIQVEAASLCTYSESNELNSKAANVKVFYEIVKEEVESEMFYLKKYFKITIANVTKDFYVEVENDNNNELYRYTHLNATDGIITFNWENLDDITNFTFKVYSSDNTSCPDERYKTLYLTTPRFNDFYNRMVCLENPDFYMCQEFVTFKEIEETDFITKFNDFINKKENGNSNDDKTEKPENDKGNFIEEYKFFIVGAIVLMGISLVIYRIKTKKQRELGL